MFRGRPGEGTPVPVRISPVVGTSGESLSYMELDLREAPVPERRYVCDLASLSFDRNTVKIMFGQQRIGKTALRSLVVVHMSKRGVEQFLSSVDKMTHPTYQEIIAMEGLSVEALPTIDEEPDQTIALQANLVITAMSGPEALMDFFQLSPSALLGGADAATRQTVPLEPVLRVDLRSTLMIGIFSRLRAQFGNYESQIKRTTPS
jgi:hypothetical protein